MVSTRSRALPGSRPVAAEEIPASTRSCARRRSRLLDWLGLVPYRLRLRRLFAWLTWPDGGIGWAPFAFLAAFRAARRDRPDVLFSTSHAAGGHLVALTSTG